MEKTVGSPTVARATVRAPSSKAVIAASADTCQEALRFSPTPDFSRMEKGMRLMRSTISGATAVMMVSARPGPSVVASV